MLDQLSWLRIQLPTNRMCLVWTVPLYLGVDCPLMDLPTGVFWTANDLPSQSAHSCALATAGGVEYPFVLCFSSVICPSNCCFPARGIHHPLGSLVAGRPVAQGRCPAEGPFKLGDGDLPVPIHIHLTSKPRCFDCAEKNEPRVLRVSFGWNSAPLG